MMPRLIDADKAKEVLTKLLYETALNNSCGASLMCEDIAENRLETWFGLVPTVDAVPLEDYKSMEQTVNKLTKAIADVVPVIRCKDCKHYFADPWGWGNCVFEGGVSRRTKKDDFCSWGERKEDG